MKTNQSATIGKLCAALSKFHGLVTDPVKTENGFPFSYAKLPSLLNIARPLCAKLGLAFTQLPTNTIEHAHIAGCVTKLMFEDEWVESEYYEIIPDGQKCWHHRSGTAQTYCRKMTLAAVLGVAQADSDGSDESAYDKKKDHESPSYTGKVHKAKEYTPVNKNYPKNKKPTEPTKPAPSLNSKLIQMVVNQNVPESLVQAWVEKAQLTNSNIKTLKDFTEEQATKAIKFLELKANG